MVDNNNSHRAFLIKEMQVQADQANRIEKQIIKVLDDNEICGLKLDAHNKELWFVTPNGTKCINSIEIHTHNQAHQLYLFIDNTIVAADDYEYTCNIDWVELMYRVLESIEPNIMD